MAIDLDTKIRKEGQDIIREMYGFLSDPDNRPATVRQVYYYLVSREIVANNQGRYDRVSDLSVFARRKGIIPWSWIEDRLRQPRTVPQWGDLPSFLETVKVAYQRNVWDNQQSYFEVWLEKDALSGFFEDALRPYGVTLNVGRGYDGWDSIENASRRFRKASMRGQHTSILYFGDFDPSGEDMVRSLHERLQGLNAHPDTIKCALTFEDVALYNLPPQIPKDKDARSAGHIAKYGNVSVELDALPTRIMVDRLVETVEMIMDMDALNETKAVQAREQLFIERMIDEAS